MLVDLPAGYQGQAENVTLTNAVQDIFQIASGSTVAMVVTHILVTGLTVNQNTMRTQLLRRTSASSSSAASGSFIPTSASSGAAAASLLIGCTTLGTAGALLPAQGWNVAAALEFDLRPNGIVIPAASWLCLYSPAAFGATLGVSVCIEAAEAK
jgi:hypothetical protein